MAADYTVLKPLHKGNDKESSPLIPSSCDGTPKTIRGHDSRSPLETEWLKLLDILQTSSSKMDLSMLRQFTSKAANECSSPAPEPHKLGIHQKPLLVVQQQQHNGGSPSLSRSNIEKRLILSQKKTVVNIEQNITHCLNSEKVGVFSGTGFIVDAAEGIIATNYHIAGTSPQQVKITFENGESTEALVLHYDVWHDFAFYKVDVKSLNFPLQEAKLGESFSLEEQAEVFLIGNNDDREYSVKVGTVTNLTVDGGKRHSHCIQTSFDRTGGSSGSPVFDADGMVVAIHTSGTNTTSFELRVEYLKDALAQLKASGKVERGDIGVELELIRLSDACLHFNLPTEVANRIKSTREDLKYITFIHKSVPLATSTHLLKPGDLIVELDGQLIGDNIYLFDKLVDNKVGKTVNITVYRNGQKLNFDIQVEDVEKTKVKKFALFAGGVFHDITSYVRGKFETHGDGVFLSHVVKGSCLTGLGSEIKDQPMAYATVIEEISGYPTPNLDAFVAAVKNLLAAQKRHINVLSRNLRDYRTCLKPKPVILDLKFSPLRVFEYSPTQLNWVEVESSSYLDHLH
jgi:S1-C subfamily serine protease